MCERISRNHEFDNRDTNAVAIYHKDTKDTKKIQFCLICVFVSLWQIANRLFSEFAFPRPEKWLQFGMWVFPQ